RVPMTHYSVDKWSDYVRGLAPAEEQRNMDCHLESGCENCKKVEGMWRATMKLAKKEIDYQPPDSALRFVMGQFGPTGLGGKLRPTARVAQLIFDSYRQPLPAGVRASLAAPWQLIYRSGTILVDVR